MLFPPYNTENMQFGLTGLPLEAQWSLKATYTTKSDQLFILVSESNVTLQPDQPDGNTHCP